MLPKCIKVIMCLIIVFSLNGAEGGLSGTGRLIERAAPKAVNALVQQFKEGRTANEVLGTFLGYPENIQNYIIDRVSQKIAPWWASNIAAGNITLEQVLKQLEDVPRKYFIKLYIPFAHQFKLYTDTDMPGFDRKLYNFSVQDLYTHKKIDKRIPQLQSWMEQKSWIYKILDLSDLGIARVDGLSKLPGFGDIDYIDLSNNNIKHLPAHFLNGAYNLKKINLSKNQISDIDEKAFSKKYELGSRFEQAQNIDLRDNLLPVHVINKMLVRLGKGSKVDIRGNPLTPREYKALNTVAAVKKIQLKTTADQANKAFEQMGKSPRQYPQLPSELRDEMIKYIQYNEGKY